MSRITKLWQGMLLNHFPWLMFSNQKRKKKSVFRQGHSTFVNSAGTADCHYLFFSETFHYLLNKSMYNKIVHCRIPYRLCCQQSHHLHTMADNPSISPGLVQVSHSPSDPQSLCNTIQKAFKTHIYMQNKADSVELSKLVKA